DVVAVARVERDADARRHENLFAVHLERLADGSHEVDGEFRNLLDELAHVCGTADQHGEFVPGQPARNRGIVELALNTSRENFEARVPRRMAERVVDVFEAIEVEIEERD